MTWSKRALDIVVAGVGLVVCAPLLAVIALLIRADSPGPVLYGGKRIGRDGNVFTMWKFRTMVRDAATRGAGITQRHDPRVTRVGRWLRRTKLDEIPQLWNVLRGEMTLVGPRPEDPNYLKYYTPAQRAVLEMPPGITGVASVRFRHEEDLISGADWEQTYVRLLGQKLDLELIYLKERSFWTDLRLVMETFAALFRRGADPSHAP